MPRLREDFRSQRHNVTRPTPFLSPRKFSPKRALTLRTIAPFVNGNDGRGKTQIGQNLYPKAPDMRLPQTQNLTDGEIYYTIHNGIRLTGMPAWGRDVTDVKDEDSWKLVLFIRHLPQLTPAEEGEMEALNPKGPGERQEE